MQMRDVRITTIDNPYDVYDDFQSWFMYDVEHGYNTCGYLDRVSHVTPDMTDQESSQEVERAIDEIIKYDFMNMYRKVVRGS